MTTSGDYIEQTFADPGYEGVDGLTYSIFVYNDLNASLGLAILINGVEVDSPTISGCGFCEATQIVSNTVTFAPIVGLGSYVLEIELTSTVPGGEGAIEFNGDGSFTLTAAPEPASVVVLGSGLASLAALRRRRQQVAK